MIFLYKILSNIFFISMVPFLPFVCFFSEKRKANMLSRFGIRTNFIPKKPGRKRIWIHALSVGEVISALPFIKALKDRHGELDIVFTASTKTGFDMAEQLFSTPVKNLADQLGYFPFDLGWCIKKINGQITPDAVVLVETDLWPNFLYEMKQNKTPVVVINARLSKRSLKGYLFFKSFSSLFFSFLTGIMAQTFLDKKRFQSIGIDPHKISVVGNIKFDQPHEEMDEKTIADMKDRFGYQKSTKVLVAGSTHEGEEKILCRVYQKLHQVHPDFLMILAPRDPKRCPELLSWFLSHHIRTVLLSEMDKPHPGTRIILVDRMGELSRLYAICDVAFIGGSMVRQGGHNPLEAAVFSKPVLFGSDMSDFQVISELLLGQGGGKIVASEQALEKELEGLLKNRQVREQMGRASYDVFLKNAGAVQRIIKNMEHLHIV